MKQATKNPKRPLNTKRVTKNRCSHSYSGKALRIAGTVTGISLSIILVVVAGFPDLLSAILLTTSLALLFDLAFFGIFSQRFSILTMCFCFYHIFFYIVPGIVHISENRFPFYGLSYPIEEVRSASVLILVFTAAVYSGAMLCARRVKVASPDQRAGGSERYSNLRILLLVSIGLMVLAGMAGRYVGWDFFLARRGGENSSILDRALVENQIVINMARFASFVSCMSMWLMARKEKTVPFTVLAIAMTFIAVFFNAPQSIPRFYLFGYILVIIYVSVDMSRPLRKFSLFMVMSMSMVILFPLANMISRGDINHLEYFDPVDYYRTSGDFDGMQSTLNVVHYVDQQGTRKGGQLAGTAFTFIPRSIWPDKPQPTGSLAAQNIGYHFLNISAPLPSEIYIDFWYPGAVILGFLIGFALLRVDMAARIYQRSDDVMLTLFLGLIIGFETIVLRGSLMAALAPIALILGLTYLALFLSSRGRRRSRNQRRQPGRSSRPIAVGRR